MNAAEQAEALVRLVTQLRPLAGLDVANLLLDGAEALEEVERLREALNRRPDGHHRHDDCLIDCDFNADRGCETCAVNRYLEALAPAKDGDGNGD